jgi:hypothetical protein
MANTVEGNASPLSPLAIFSKRMLHTSSDLLIPNSQRRSRRRVNGGKRRKKKREGRMELKRQICEGWYRPGLRK